MWHVISYLCLHIPSSHEIFDETFPPTPTIIFFRFVNILLPSDAKEIATRFRWWQPRHDGLDQNDWAIDNVLISGSADQRTVMLDTFSSAPVPQHERSPSDAGPVGRIAFDMFMEDKTAGKFFTDAKWKSIWVFSKKWNVEPFTDSQVVQKQWKGCHPFASLNLPGLHCN